MTVRLVQRNNWTNSQLEVTGILQIQEPINSQIPRIYVKILSAEDLNQVIASFIICPTDYYHYLDNKDGTFFCAFDNKDRNQRNVLSFKNAQYDLKDAMLEKIVDCFTEWSRLCKTLLESIKKSEKDSSTIHSSGNSYSSMKTETSSNVSGIDISDNENGQREGEARALEYFNHVFKSVQRSPIAGPNQNNEEADLLQNWKEFDADYL